MAPRKEQEVYLRNGRPNGLVIKYAGNRFNLRHRGHREDSIALPEEALTDRDIARWVKQGVLEKISKDSFLELGRRQVDTLPNEFLQRKIRNTPKGELAMHPADADTTRSLTQIKDTDIIKVADPAPKWAGDLMSTAEELETMEFDNATQAYPSKYRDEEQRRQMGY